jgi:hypothetical protein
MKVKTQHKISFFLFLPFLCLNLLLFNTAGAQTGKVIRTEKSALLSYKNKGVIKPVKTVAEWEKKKSQILDSMQAVMGKMPSRKNLPSLDIQVIDSLKEVNYTRYTINFAVAENERLPALLYVPFKKSKTQKFPAMLVLHGTGANGKRIVDGDSYSPNHAQAKELALRGYVVIAPDYPSFGDMKDYDFDHDRYESGTMKGIFDHMRCIDLLQSRKDVKPDCIGVLGHSLGGHNSIFVGAFDKRIKVIVSSCGWTLFDYYNAGEEVTKKFGGTLGPWAQTRYMPLVRDKYHLDPAGMPFDFDEIIASLAPRAFFSNSPLKDANFDVQGVKKGIPEIAKVYHFLKADDNLQVRYPDAQHDFPPDVRLEAYRFIDQVFKHTPSVDELK